MAHALANLRATFTLGKEEDMTNSFCDKWVGTSSEDEFIQEINVVSVHKVEKEDWH